MTITWRSLARARAFRAQCGFLLALISVSGWTAPAALGQGIDLQTLLTARVAPGSGRSQTNATQSQTAPLIYIVGNAASFLQPFSAGQLVTIFGPGLGPTPGVGATVSNGFVTDLAGGTQVLFDNVAVPVLYAGANQVNTVIPCAVAGHASTSVVVNYSGTTSAAVTLPLSEAAPGIFTLNSGGTGQAAMLNQDNSVNGPANPAAPGSVVVLYATGLGATSPACTDGEVYTTTLPKPNLAVTATIGGMPAQIQYAGQAPEIISGVAQINVIVPADAPTGPSVPISISSGTFASQSGVTLAIK